MDEMYKFNEGRLIEEFKSYVDNTYDQHYATDKYQATDIILDSGHGEGFCLGNVIKYAKRYGKKGDSSTARQDLMKIMHYTLIQLFNHDEQNKDDNVLLDGIRIGDIPTFTLTDTDLKQTELDLLYPDDYIENGGTIKIDDETLSLLFPTTTLDKEHKRLNDATPEEWDRATKKRKTNV